MPRKKRASSPMDLYDDDFDEDASSHSSQPPVQRNAANARERMRMRVLSSAYGRLKTKLPNIPADTKLSKLDTLRLATLYIKQLITAVDTGSSVNASDLLDTSHLAGCVSGGGAGSGGGGGGGGGGIGAFNFHNGGHGGMSWPFEFHQHFPHANRSSSSNLSFGSSRMDWQQQQQQQSCSQRPRQEAHLTAEVSYTQLPVDAHVHWYPATQMEQMQDANTNAYEIQSFGQHQRSMGSSQAAHGL